MNLLSENQIKGVCLVKTEFLFSNFPFISAEQVSLNRPTALESGGLWEIFSREENIRYSPLLPFKTQSETTLFLQQADALFRSKKAVVLGVFSSDNPNRLLGLLEITDPDVKTECVTLRFLWNRARTGTRTMTYAVCTAIKYLIQTVGVNRIQTYVMPENRESIQILEHCAFQKEGTVRQGFYWPGKGVIDLALYSLLPSDLLALAQKNDSSFFSL